MREFMWITKALADESRLRILLLLSQGELCVCQIIAIIGLAPSTVSKHMSILHQAGLVESRKTGRWVYYHLPHDKNNPVVNEVLDWVIRSVGETPQAVRDRRELTEVVRVDPEVLCQLPARHQTSKPLALSGQRSRKGK